MLLKVIPLFFLLVDFLNADDHCVDYMNRVGPLLESGDIASLREVFKTMNSEQNNIITPYAMYSIEASVFVDSHLMKQLVSLSKPFLRKMNDTDMWPENNNAPLPFGKVCEKDFSGELVCSDAASEFHAHYNPYSTHHGGIRYVYNCKTLQVKTCFKGICTYNPDVPAMKNDAKNIFVPLDNFIAADGSAMADHVTEGDDAYVIKGFNKMAVRECFARQVFFAPAENGCFNSSMYFSLPEIVAMGGNSRERDGVAPWYDFMIAKPDYFVVVS